MSTLLEQEQEYREEYVYAGFWKRFLAYIIDSIFISVPSYILSTIILTVLLGAESQVLMSGSEEEIAQFMESSAGIEAILTSLGLIIVLNILMSILYYAVMEASKWQATLGKKLVGLKVTTLSGQRIGFGRSFGRLLVKSLLSPILMIGYIMAAFTEKKQALHDLVASTLVVQKHK
ncbi:RDD family protein [Mangrovibacillus cuniculi]|uniref:RDD family protein n=1 Tax=Mangrovibacillus cuniculi TaxID=2593652 RepID=UPI001EFA0CFB|nr:RDD family protein [Mangrovibacillus cuniculi]